MTPEPRLPAMPPMARASSGYHSQSGSLTGEGREDRRWAEDHKTEEQHQFEYPGGGGFEDCGVVRWGAGAGAFWVGVLFRGMVDCADGELHSQAQTFSSNNYTKYHVQTWLGNCIKGIHYPTRNFPFFRHQNYFRPHASAFKNCLFRYQKHIFVIPPAWQRGVEHAGHNARKCGQLSNRIWIWTCHAFKRSPH